MMGTIQWTDSLEVQPDRSEDCEHNILEKDCKAELTENEKTDRDEDTGEERELQEVLGWWRALAHHLGLHDKVVQRGVEDVGDHHSENESDVRKTGETLVEVVDADEDNWEGLEPEVEDGVGDYIKFSS